MIVTRRLMWPFLLMLLVALAGQAQEEQAMEDEEPSISVELGLDYASKYIWRGQEINDEPVLQPSVTLGYEGFGINWWGNYDLTDGGREDNFSEYDWTVFYGDTIDIVGWEVGFIEYYFPGTGDGEDNDTKEVYAKLEVDTILAPSLSVYYDAEEIHGFYGLLSIGHGWVLDDEEKWSFELGASIAYADSDYNDGYFGVSDHGWNDATLSASLSCAVTENFSVGYSLNYSELVDSDVEDAVDSGGGDSDNLWFVWSAAYTF